MTERRHGETSAASPAQDSDDSTPWWPEPRPPRAGAPNVVFVVLDDVGFSDFGCYGSEIATPTIDALAAGGLRYTDFHTTALCSPTRACLLTGRNHHAVGMGGLADWDHGFPGTRGRIARAPATLAEMLRANGYNTCAVGKWHLTPMAETLGGRPFDAVADCSAASTATTASSAARPTSSTPSWSCDNHPIATARPARATTSPRTWSTTPSSYMRDQTALAPDRPFFLYLAFGACHAPHQAPRELHRALRWPVRRRAGTARARIASRARSRWASCRPAPSCRRATTGVRAVGRAVRRRAAPRRAPAGRLRRHARARRRRSSAGWSRSSRRSAGCDDTLIVLISDNGASQEGSALGTVNAARYFNAVRDDLAYNLEHLDEIGEAHLNNNYPLGWAMAGNTPLKRYKQNTHGGGVRDPLIVSWPARIRERGGDPRASSATSPTSRRRCSSSPGIEAPAEIGGVAQQPIEGTSLRLHVRRRPTSPHAQARASTSRCSATAASGTTAGRRSPGTSRAPASTRTAGSSTTSTRTGARARDLAAQRAREAGRDDRALVDRGRPPPGAAAARRDRRAVERRRQSATGTARADASCSTPASSASRPTPRPTCATARTRSPPRS